MLFQELDSWVYELEQKKDKTNSLTSREKCQLDALRSKRDRLFEKHCEEIRSMNSLMRFSRYERKSKYCSERGAFRFYENYMNMQSPIQFTKYKAGDIFSAIDDGHIDYCIVGVSPRASTTNDEHSYFVECRCKMNDGAVQYEYICIKESGLDVLMH